MLFHSWGGSFSRRGLNDIVVNLVLYIPLGMPAYLVFRKSCIPLAGIWGPVLLGGVLSASMEMTQLFVPGRDCSALDLLNNVISSVLGVIAGVIFERIAGPEHPDFLALTFVNRRPADRSALALLFCWIGALLFPLFPVLWLSVLRHKLVVLVHAPLFEAIPLISAALCWFAGGRLMDAAGFRHIRLSLAILLLLVPAQILVVTRQPQPAEFLGAAVGVLVFYGCRAWPGMAKLAGWTFLGMLVLRGLSPFYLLAKPLEFMSIPFGASLATGWQPGIRVLLEKTFYYGVAIWLLRAGGMRMRNATALVALVLGAVEAAQRYLPGRTPEITDPVMAVLIGSALWAMGPDPATPVFAEPPGF